MREEAHTPCFGVLINAPPLPLQARTLEEGKVGGFFESLINITFLQEFHIDKKLDVLFFRGSWIPQSQAQNLLP